MVDLVVNPNHRLMSSFSAIEPPVWAGLIASYHNADILDAEALNLSLDQTEEAIRERDVKDVMIVVMGNNPSVSSTPKFPIARALSQRIDDLNVIMTGIHPIATGYPGAVMQPFSGFPMMPWDRLPMNLYRAHNWHCLDGSDRQPYASVYTSLGCPYDCYYCNIHTLYGDRQVRFRPVRDVIGEIGILVRRGVRNIKFWDELFTLKEDRVISICEGLRDYNLNIWAYARVDTVTKKMVEAMKTGGINWLAYGFESIQDKKFIDRTEEVIKMTRDAGINIIGNFMFGLPNTTQDDDQKSLDFAMTHLFEYVNFYVARPYPGSKWYEDTKPDMKELDFDQYGENRSSFRDNAFRAYFTNPDYLLMLKGKFGEQAVRQIEDMLRSR